MRPNRITPEQALAITSTAKTFEQAGQLALGIMNQMSNHREIVGLAWEVKSCRIAGTHNHPVKGGRRHDWKGPARRYPGWSGRLWLRSRHHKHLGSPDWVNESAMALSALLHTGTGGSGLYSGQWPDAYHTWYSAVVPGHPRRNYLDGEFRQPHCFGWDLKMYEWDWPGLAEMMRKKQTAWRLRGEDRKFTNRFEWTNPDVIEEDRQMIARWKEIQAEQEIKAGGV